MKVYIFKRNNKFELHNLMELDNGTRYYFGMKIADFDTENEANAHITEMGYEKIEMCPNFTPCGCDFTLDKMCDFCRYQGEKDCKNFKD